jgi:hypothetical protein
MNDQFIQGLIKAYDYDEGFLGNLKQCIFNEKLYDEFYALLLSMANSDEEVFSRDIVSMLWFIPVFMERQKEYVCRTFSRDTYFSRQEDVIDAIAGILGYP